VPALAEPDAALPWRAAMQAALYGSGGFYTRTGPPGGASGHFRTSAHASVLFATAVLRLLAAMDEGLGRPAKLDLVDVGAGGGQLLRRLVELAPAHLAKRLRPCGVELAPRPQGLPDRIGWGAQLPEPASLTGLLVATEWLDNVPLDVAEGGADGVLRYRLVDPATGDESAGQPISDADTVWARRWWPASGSGWSPGLRVELGGPRDLAWARAVAAIDRGVALTVDYGHSRMDRPRTGTLTGFQAGRQVRPVPDGHSDLTAHVAIDAVRAAGETVAGQPAVLMTQRRALTALGIDGARPPVALASTDPEAYVRGLSSASQAAELTDRAGLGGHYWLVQPVGVPASALPSELRG
jgi:SAM-dependent MidA family methyltransferase